MKNFISNLYRFVVFVVLCFSYSTSFAQDSLSIRFFGFKTGVSCSSLKRNSAGKIGTLWSAQMEWQKNELTNFAVALGFVGKGSASVYYGKNLTFGDVINRGNGDIYQTSDIPPEKMRHTYTLHYLQSTFALRKLSQLDEKNYFGFGVSLSPQFLLGVSNASFVTYSDRTEYARKFQRGNGYSRKFNLSPEASLVWQRSFASHLSRFELGIQYGLIPIEDSNRKKPRLWDIGFYYTYVWRTKR